MNEMNSDAKPAPRRPLVAPEISPARGFDRWRTSMIASSNSALTSIAREPSCTSTADGSKPGGGWNDIGCAGARYAGCACCGGANGDGTGAPKPPACGAPKPPVGGGGNPPDGGCAGGANCCAGGGGNAGCPVGGVIAGCGGAN